MSRFHPKGGDVLGDRFRGQLGVLPAELVTHELTAYSP